MNNTPIVSAITIFLNAERFLEQAIESVFSQTYPHWELLLVDDGSTDESTAIAFRYAARFPNRIRYLSHPRGENRGMSASRNLGLREAIGELVAFLDADDVWLPEKLERQVAAICDCHAAGMVCGPTEYWWSWTRQADHRPDALRGIGEPPGTVTRPPKLIPLLPEERAKTPATCSILVRREVFDRIGGFEERFRGLYEDQAFFAKLYLHIPVLTIADCLDRYRQHPESCCARATQAGRYHSVLRNPAHWAFLSWLNHYLDEQGIFDRAIREPVRRALWPYEHPFMNTGLEMLTKPRATSASIIRAVLRRGLPEPVVRRIAVMLGRG